MKDIYAELTDECCPENRGISGQSLKDSTNPPGDPHTGTPGPGGDVNLDPKSRDDEGY